MEKNYLTLSTIVLLGSLVYLQQAPLDESLDASLAFQAFKMRFNKAYPINEEPFRFAVYTTNMRYIQDYNTKTGRKVFGETQFVDLTDEEFAETYLTLKIDQNNDKERISRRLDSNLDSIDWVARGAVTHIKDQGQCGSCWAFSVTGVLEGYFFVEDGQLLDLSEQQVLDCARLFYADFGCFGGITTFTLNFVQKHGITLQGNYPIPYQAKRSSKCLMKGGEYYIGGSKNLEKTEEALIAQLQVQPVSVAVDASNWKYYAPQDESDLIFSDCGKNLNHAVLAIGYDSESIKIKNSWSASWGAQGFIYLKRGENTCGVWDDSVVPTSS